MTGNIDTRCSRIVLVEGGDEENLLPKLLNQDSSSEDIQFISVGGNKNFIKTLPILLKHLKQNGIELRSLGLVGDSDHNPEGAFARLQHAVKNVGLPTPKSHASFAGSCPTVGIFVVPNSTTCGTIDTLCRESVVDDVRTECVDDYLNCLENLKMPVGNPDKSFVYAYSIAVGMPCVRAGKAAKRNIWNFDHETFQPLSTF